MSSNGPYKPSRPSQEWLQKVYEDQMQMNADNYIKNYLNDIYVVPDIYIAGQRYSGTTGKRIYDNA